MREFGWQHDDVVMPPFWSAALAQFTVDFMRRARELGVARQVRCDSSSKSESVFQINTRQRLAQEQKQQSAPVLNELSKTAQNAYQATLQRYHGPMFRSVTMGVLRLLPGRHVEWLLHSCSLNK